MVRPRDAHRDLEHSLEMQLPFLAAVLPAVPIVPLVMGAQTRDTIEALARALAEACHNRRALLVASSDLSHFYDAATAERLDGEVCASIEAFNPEQLMEIFERYSAGERGRHVGCGIGPAISVMMAARTLGRPRGAGLALRAFGRSFGRLRRGCRLRGGGRSERSMLH